MTNALYLGIDFGTSGARAIAIDCQSTPCADARLTFADVSTTALPQLWQESLFALLQKIPEATRQRVKAIAINGTSATVLRCDGKGQPLDAPMLYNDSRGRSLLHILDALIPPDPTDPTRAVAMSATSSLVKLLWWTCADAVANRALQPPEYFLHQADWLGFLLHGQLGVSDYHNSLKLGYDVGNLCYPDWMARIPTPMVLPRVVAPGTPVGTVQGAIASQYHLPADCLVCAGTTDSIAAFLASGAHQPGTAVTSLGSTLVLKLLSTTRVDDSRFGIYSHRLGDLWLVGGASNTGGAALKAFFSDDELATLSQKIPCEQESPLDYYPLTQPGERFPVSDPTLSPRLEPRPDDPVAFLHGLLESIARIEALGYRRLQELGATPLRTVLTAGGGAQNEAWSAIRQRHLGVKVGRSRYTEAAHGSARLAQQGLIEWATSKAATR
ncbi:MAG: FGGY-family carbohydrate kinase [Synechococcales bacterium]|nr:FGGY-family carbohydrate kinase [Synechococcales bacterium]